MTLPPAPDPARDHYALVPGMTAYRMNRIARRTYLLLSLAMLPVSVGAGLTLAGHGRRDMISTEILLIAMLVLIPLVTITALSLALNRRDRAEGAAGYTTRTSGRTSFDQVDPANGMVIRRANSAVFTVPPSTTATATAAGAGTAAGADAMFFPVPARRRRTAAIGIAAATFVFVAIMAALLLPLVLGRDDPVMRNALLLALAIVLVTVAVTVTATFALLRWRAHARIRRVAAVRPGDVVFLSPQTPELRHALSASGIPAAPSGIGGQFVVSAGGDGIRLWKGRVHRGPSVTIPWSRVDHIQAGRLMVVAGRSTVSYRTVHMFLSAPAQGVDVPLPLLSPHGATNARAEYANEILRALSRFTRLVAPTA